MINAMSLMKIGTETIDTRTFDLYVDEHGWCIAEFETARLHSESKKTLIDKLRSAVRSHTRVQIAAVLLTGDDDLDAETNRSRRITFTPIVLTGIQGSNRHVLYSVVGKKGGEQMGGYRHEAVLRPLTDGERAQLQPLYTASVAARKAYQARKKQLTIDPQLAITKAAKAPKAAV